MVFFWYLKALFRVKYIFIFDINFKTWKYNLVKLLNVLFIYIINNGFYFLAQGQFFQIVRNLTQWNNVHRDSWINKWNYCYFFLFIKHYILFFKFAWSYLYETLSPNIFKAYWRKLINSRKHRAAIFNWVKSLLFKL